MRLTLPMGSQTELQLPLLVSMPCGQSLQDFARDGVQLPYVVIMQDSQLLCELRCSNRVLSSTLSSKFIGTGVGIVTSAGAGCGLLMREAESACRIRRDHHVVMTMNFIVGGNYLLQVLGIPNIQFASL